MIETPEDLKRARRELGWTQAQLGEALRLSGDSQKLRKRIDDMEMGQREISGPVSVAVEAFLDGWRPRSD